jgi:hypothetical protein
MGGRDGRLILLDGLPGSGKTTAAAYLAGRITDLGRAVALYPETMAEHPLNVGGPLHPAGETSGGALFARYDVPAYVAESLARWQTFVRSAAQGPTVHVAESYPYQSAARVLLQMDAPTERILAYAQEVETVIAPLAPALVYFERPDAAAALRTIAAHRGPTWTAYVAEMATDCPYARRLGLTGLDGAVSVIGAYKALLDDLVAHSRLPRVVLLDCGARWAACYDQMTTFLGL